MRYWDEDLPEWDVEELELAAAWRSRPKWIISHSLMSVGSNATLVDGDLEAEMRRLKAERAGEIGGGGRDLARSLATLLSSISNVPI